MKEYKASILVTAPIEVNRQDLADILSIVHEGGIHYWGALKVPNDDAYIEAKARLQEGGVDMEEVCWEDVLVEILVDGGVLAIYDYEEGEKHEFNLDDLEDAIAAAGWEYGTDLDDWDGCTGDFIGQYLCFGEVIYG